jgi:hypothetical protein
MNELTFSLVVIYLLGLVYFTSVALKELNQWRRKDSIITMLYTFFVLIWPLSCIYGALRLRLRPTDSLFVILFFGFALALLGNAP